MNYLKIIRYNSITNIEKICYYKIRKGDEIMKIEQVKIYYKNF